MDISPRMTATGELKWYDGDNFNIEWKLELTRDDEPLVFDAQDKIIFTFFNCEKTEIKSFICTNITNNTVYFSIDKTTSALFKVGRYTYCIKYVDAKHSNYVTTIAANRKAEVLPCH